MKQSIGIELEFTGVTQEQVASALANLFEIPYAKRKLEKDDDVLDCYKICDKYGNVWTVTKDASIRPQVYTKAGDTSSVQNIPIDESLYKCELISPVIDHETLPVLFTILDVLKCLGGFVNESCGLHVHVSCPRTVKEVITIFNRFCIDQDNIIKRFNVHESRLNYTCAKYDPVKVPPDSCYDMNDFISWLWENYRDFELDASCKVYSSKSLRYHVLNMFSIFEHETIEFRLFNATLDKRELASIIDWVLHFMYNDKVLNDLGYELSKVLYTPCEDD